MPVDASIYSNLQPPPNPLTTLGNFASVQNALTHNRIAQQTLQQQQIATQQAQDIQNAMSSLQNYKNSDGSPNYNAWLSDTAINHPLAIQTALDVRKQQTGSLVGAYDTNGNPVLYTPEKISTMLGGNTNVSQSPNAQQPSNTNASPSNSSSLPGGLPADPLKQRDYYQGKLADNDTAQRDIAPLENIYGILKKNPNDQGTQLGALDTLAARYNIDLGGTKDAATALQIIKDHAAQLNLPHHSDTDSDALKRELANLNPTDLGGSLLKMIPYLIGNRAMVQDQVQYLNQKAPGGVNPTSIGDARAFLQPRSDARVYELRWLQQNDPAAYQERLKGLSKPELNRLADMDDELSIKKPLNQQ